MNKPQILLHLEKNLEYSAFDVKWMPKSAKVISIGSYARGTGVIQVFELGENCLESISEIERPKALKCGTFGAASFEDRHLAVGDIDGNLEVLDLSSPQTPTYSVKAHSTIINSIDGVGGLNIGKGAPELVTGSRDGTVKVWDPRQNEKPVVCIEPAEDEERRDCWTVAFGNSHSSNSRCVCAGFDNGDLKLFDLRTASILWEDTLKNGICSVQFDRKDIEMNKLVVTTLESTFVVYDMRTFNKESGYASLEHKSHNSTVWTAKHLPQNRDIFVTGGGNGTFNLWKYIYPAKRQETLEDGAVQGVVGSLEALNGIALSSQPLTGIDWSPDKTGLCSCVSIDQTLKIAIVTKLNTL